MPMASAKRVALTPQSALALQKLGYDCLIEAGAAWLGARLATLRMAPPLSLRTVVSLLAGALLTALLGLMAAAFLAAKKGLIRARASAKSSAESWANTSEFRRPS